VKEMMELMYLKEMAYLLQQFIPKRSKYKCNWCIWTSIKQYVNRHYFYWNCNNVINIPGANLVLGWTNPQGYSPDNRFTPKENAPSNGAGVGGENIGAFTNSSSYILSGIPFVPNIYELDAPDFGTTGSGITINIKAKANN
jgi:hypothetical protein